MDERAQGEVETIVDGCRRTGPLGRPFHAARSIAGDGDAVSVWTMPQLPSPTQGQGGQHAACESDGQADRGDSGRGRAGCRSVDRPRLVPGVGFGRGAGGLAVVGVGVGSVFPGERPLWTGPRGGRLRWSRQLWPGVLAAR